MASGCGGWPDEEMVAKDMFKAISAQVGRGILLRQIMVPLLPRSVVPQSRAFRQFVFPTAPLALCCLSIVACAQQGNGSRSLAAAAGRYSPAITEADLRKRLFIFADDSMQGREAGTVGHEKALTYIVGELTRLGVKPAGENGYYQRVPLVPRRAPAGARVDTSWSRNVIAVIEGSDPTLKTEYVALGAHSDHVGFARRAVDHDSMRAFLRAGWEAIGRDANARGASPDQLAAIRVNMDSLRKIRPSRRDSINNGADDDGSGSMALLEIAEAFATNGTKPKRSLLLVWHTAEEKGLVGAAWFTDNPTVDRNKIVAQINIDMIGRGSARDVKGGGDDFLTVLGPKRLSSQFDQWVRDVNDKQPRPLKLDYEFDGDGHPQQFYCRSDHYEYARYGIPIAFFFTSIHEDYHQVTDEPQYIEYPKYTRITQYLYDVAAFTANQPQAPMVDKPKPDPAGTCRQ